MANIDVKGLNALLYESRGLLSVARGTVPLYISQGQFGLAKQNQKDAYDSWNLLDAKARGYISQVDPNGPYGYWLDGIVQEAYAAKEELSGMLTQIAQAAIASGIVITGPKVPHVSAQTPIVTRQPYTPPSGSTSPAGSGPMAPPPLPPAVAVTPDGSTLLADGSVLSPYDVTDEPAFAAVPGGVGALIGWFATKNWIAAAVGGAAGLAGYLLYKQQMKRQQAAA